MSEMGQGIVVAEKLLFCGQSRLQQWQMCNTMTGGNTAKILLLKEIAVGVRAFLTVTGNAAFAVPDVHPSAAAAATSTVS